MPAPVVFFGSAKIQRSQMPSDVFIMLKYHDDNVNLPYLGIFKPAPGLTTTTSSFPEDKPFNHHLDPNIQRLHARSFSRLPDHRGKGQDAAQRIIDQTAKKIAAFKAGRPLRMVS
jgi:hypothetical protein